MTNIKAKKKNVETLISQKELQYVLVLLYLVIPKELKKDNT